MGSNGAHVRGITRLVTSWSKLLAILAFSVAACAGGTAGEETTAVTLQGFGGGFGTGVDTQIVENELVNYGTRDRILVRGDGSGTAPVAVGLVKWPLAGGFNGTAGTAGSSNTASCTVQSASIRLQIMSTSNQSFRLYPALRAWKANEANWTQATLTSAWDVAGAMSPNDRGAPFQEFTPNTTGGLSIPLNAAGIALVQAWIDQPASNFGIVLGHETHSDGFTFASFESSLPHPILSVTCN
jgi:hypothetical protein